MLLGLPSKEGKEEEQSMIKHSSHMQNFEMFLVLRTIRDMRIHFRLRLALVRLSFFLRLRLHTPKEDVNMIYVCHVTCRKTSAGLSTFICTHVFVIFQKKSTCAAARGRKGRIAAAESRK